MRLHIASDLHLDHYQGRFPGLRLIEPAPGADALVLAGDIGAGLQAVNLFADWPVPVLFVPGNHEYYASDLREMREQLRQAAQGTRVRVLDDESVVMGGVRLVGSTLWTDFALPGATPDEHMAAAQRRIADFAWIKIGERAFDPHDALAEHARSRRYLDAVLAEPFDGPTVVVTHYAPSSLSIHPRYATSAVNASFVSELGTAFVERAALWIHGHLHDSFDYALGSCRVLANPRGYALNRRAPAPGELQFENVSFIPDLVVDVPPRHA